MDFKKEIENEKRKARQEKEIAEYEHKRALMNLRLQVEKEVKLREIELEKEVNRLNYLVKHERENLNYSKERESKLQKVFTDTLLQKMKAKEEKKEYLHKNIFNLIVGAKIEFKVNNFKKFVAGKVAEMTLPDRDYECSMCEFLDGGQLYTMENKKLEIRLIICEKCLDGINSKMTDLSNPLNTNWDIIKKTEVRDEFLTSKENIESEKCFFCKHEKKKNAMYCDSCRGCIRQIINKLKMSEADAIQQFKADLERFKR